MAAHPIPPLTEEEYLTLDRAAEYKSEFVDGHMYAMSGGTLRHSSVAVRLMSELSLQLSGRKCTVFNSDARVRSAKSRSYFYPDISVVCGEPQTHEDSDDILINPSLIVEVLSPSTADYDHGKKFAHYREIATLRDYLLVNPDEPLIEQFARQGDGKWLLSEYRGRECVVHLESLDCDVALARIYADLSA